MPWFGPTRPHGATSRPPAERRALHTDGCARALGATQRRKKGVPFVVSNLLIALFFPAEKHCPAPEQCTPTGGALCGRLASSRGGLAYTTDRRQPFSRVLSCVSHALGVRSSPTEGIFPALRLTTVSPECRPAVALVSATAVSVTSSVAQRQFAVAQPLHSLTGQPTHPLALYSYTRSHTDIIFFWFLSIRPAVALVSATAVSVTSSVAQRQFAVAQPLHSLTDGKGCHSFRKGACRRY